MTATQVRTIPPIKLTGLLQSQWANHVLKTAMELDVFAPLKGKGATAGEVAQAVGLNTHAATLLLNALVAMELLGKSGLSYKLTEIAAAYLCKDSDLYFGRYVLTRGVVDEAWAKLPEAIRTGKGQTRVNDQACGEKFFKDLTVAIFPINYTTAQAVADELKISSMPGPVHVLDLAAGSAVWSLPLAQANKNVQVDALDFPGVLDVAREFATKYGVANQYNYLAGNWRDIKLQPEHYDVILLGHILHSEGTKLSTQLLRHCAVALKKGGTLVVAEFLENEDRGGPLFASLFAINMLLMTEDGCVFTVEELKRMLVEAGLRQPVRMVLPIWGDDGPVMVAKK